MLLDDMIKELDDCSHPSLQLNVDQPLALREIWADDCTTEVYIRGLWHKRCKKCNQVVEWDPIIDQLKADINKIGIPLQKGTYSLHFGKINSSKDFIYGGGSRSIASEEKQNFVAKTPRYTLDKDVILSSETRAVIDAALIKLQYRHLIYEEWGFKSVDPIGDGAVFNFYGPPGTGKTRTAEALAGYLNLTFLNVDYGKLESKYLGETPENIELVFAAAKEQGALLFFDEADTVLGKRASEIRQAIDNETNLAKSTLLKQLEEFNGVCIFATNAFFMYDDAFKRRLAFDVKFELPDEEMRKLIWAFHLVPGIPLVEEREEIIAAAASASESFSGGDILKAMRQALPKPIFEDAENPRLAAKHLVEAIEKVRIDNKGELTDRQQLGKKLLNA